MLIHQAVDIPQEFFDLLIFRVVYIASTAACQRISVCYIPIITVKALGDSFR